MTETEIPAVTVAIYYLLSQKFYSKKLDKEKLQKAFRLKREVTSFQK